MQISPDRLFLRCMVLQALHRQTTRASIRWRRQNGIKVMSINLLLPTEDTPVIWRGPVLANMVKQFWTDVVWGKMRLSLCRYAAGNR